MQMSPYVSQLAESAGMERFYFHKMEEYGDYYDPVWDSKYIRIDYDADKREELRK